MKTRSNKYAHYFIDGLTNKEIIEIEKVSASVVSRARRHFKLNISNVENTAEQNIINIVKNEIKYYYKEPNLNLSNDIDTLSKDLCTLKLRQHISLTKLKTKMNEIIDIMLGRREFRELLIKEQLLSEKNLKLLLADKDKLKFLKYERTAVLQIIETSGSLKDILKNLEWNIND